MVKKSPYALGSSFRTQNLLKPQLAFQTLANNDNSSPWKPLLKTKPHALKPLEESLDIFKNELDNEQYEYPLHLHFLSCGILDLTDNAIGVMFQAGARLICRNVPGRSNATKNQDVFNRN